MTEKKLEQAIEATRESWPFQGWLHGWFFVSTGGVIRLLTSTRSDLRTRLRRLAKDGEFQVLGFLQASLDYDDEPRLKAFLKAKLAGPDHYWGANYTDSKKNRRTIQTFVSMSGDEFKALLQDLSPRHKSFRECHHLIYSMRSLVDDAKKQVDGLISIEEDLLEQRILQDDPKLTRVDSSKDARLLDHIESALDLIDQQRELLTKARATLTGKAKKAGAAK